MDLNLKGKNAVVCGSSQGIGKACAVELAELGANVILLARNEEKLRVVLGDLSRASGQQHEVLVADFENPEEVKSAIHSVTSRKTVHILVNNTGGPAPGLAIDAQLSEFSKAFSTHLLCNQILAQAVCVGMKAVKYGRIINIISTSVKMPIRGLGVSNTIRGAVANWAKTLSVELGPFGITVNNVLPGATMTSRLESVLHRNAQRTNSSIEDAAQEMIKEIPVGRIAESKEVAAAVAFLATPAAAYINGINLPVDGGRTGTL